MIAQGFLGEHAYTAKKLDVAAIPALMELQQAVVDALPDKAILQPLDEDELRFILEGNGVMIGIFVAEQLIAFRALLEPELDDEHLGRDIGLTEKELGKVLYQEISNVHPNFRGHGLQQTMANIIMKQVDTEKHQIICATVMPYNIASLKDKFAQGMHVAALKYKYGGKLRYVFTKSLIEQIEFGVELREVSMGATEEQQQLLKQGFIGAEMKKIENDWFITYRK
ncbi:MAG: GNAT family N-acetyltransferase [Solibacillus sp.]